MNPAFGSYLGYKSCLASILQMTKVKIREFKDFAEGHKGEQNLPF